MARNRSEQEPTIESISDALMHVLRSDALGVKTPRDGLYQALSDADKKVYLEMDTEITNRWDRDFRRYRRNKLAQEELRKCHAIKV